MMSLRKQYQRGVALLLTLAALVLVVTVAVGIARLSATAAMHGKIDWHSSLADDLLTAAEAPIVHWLTTYSDKVVLALDSQSPEVAVLHDQWIAGDLPFELEITAWDQQGMAPMQLIHRGSPVRLAVPQLALDVVDRMRVPDDEILGLDMLDGSDGIDAIQVWPEKGRTLSVGSLVATHNGNALINVNTAPIGLIEQAMRMAGRGGIEQIIESRATGDPASVPPLNEAESEADAPQLVGGSTCWSFRIDIRVGRAAHSWWAVYSRDGQGWTCVQRLAITR